MRVSIPNNRLGKDYTTDNVSNSKDQARTNQGKSMELAMPNTPWIVTLTDFSTTTHLNYPLSKKITLEKTPLEKTYPIARISNWVGQQESLLKKFRYFLNFKLIIETQIVFMWCQQHDFSQKKMSFFAI